MLVHVPVNGTNSNVWLHFSLYELKQLDRDKATNSFVSARTYTQYVVILL